MKRFKRGDSTSYMVNTKADMHKALASAKVGDSIYLTARLTHELGLRVCFTPEEALLFDQSIFEPPHR